MGLNPKGFYHRTGVDLGSALSIVFTDQQWKLVVGHSVGDRVWKFPCGKIEQQDCPPTDGMMDEQRFLSASANSCALRELEAEIGLTEKQLLFHHPLKYIRSWTVRDRATNAQKKLRQFHFVGLMAEGVLLPASVEEGDEMDVREYWEIRKVFKQALQPRYATDKFNPFHALALVEALLFLRNTIGDEPAFETFRNTLGALEKENLHLDTLRCELDDQIKTRRI